MQQNVGGRDRAVRMISGITLSLAGVPGVVGYAAGSEVVSASLGWLAGLAVLVGVALFVTGMTQTCPINSAIGIDTTGSDTDG